MIILYVLFSGVLALLDIPVPDVVYTYVVLLIMPLRAVVNPVICGQITANNKKVCTRRQQNYYIAFKVLLSLSHCSLVDVLEFLNEWPDKIEYFHKIYSRCN